MSNDHSRQTLRIVDLEVRIAHQDKALAELGGDTLLSGAVAALSACCAAVVVVGRDAAPAPVLPDYPRGGMGPLGGIAAALRHARDNGFDAVLTCGVDSPGLPGDLLARFAGGGVEAKRRANSSAVRAL